MSYEIHPETPVEGRPLSDYFGGADLSPMHEGLARRATEFELRFDPPDRLSNSRLAILTAEFARDHEREEGVRRRLFEAYFADGLDIGDLDVLLGIAAEEGLNTQVLRRSLKTGSLAPRITQAETEARRRRITGVPTFFFFARDPEDPTPIEAASVVGAQPLDTFRRVLDRLA